MKVDVITEVDLQKFQAMKRALPLGLLRIDHLDDYIPALRALCDHMARHDHDAAAINLGRYIRRRVAELAPAGATVVIPGWVPGGEPEWRGQEARLVEIDGMEPREWLKAELLAMLSGL